MSRTAISRSGNDERARGFPTAAYRLPTVGRWKVRLARVSILMRILKPYRVMRNARYRVWQTWP